MHTKIPMIACRTLCALFMGLGFAAAQVPDHPDELQFPRLDFEPPMSAEFLHDLDGIPVYLAPSSEWPLIDLTFTFKGGAFLEEPDEVGLGSSLGVMMRRGGSARTSAEELDERFDFLAANVSTTVGSDRSSASLNCLESNFSEAFGLFMEMVREPGFDAERLRVHLDERVEAFRQRNDNPMSVAFPRMQRLVYGDDHYLAREPTLDTVGAIDGDSLRALHRRIFHPGNLVISATGDFQPAQLLDALRSALDGWQVGESVGDPPAPVHVTKSGLYHTETSQKDLPQGTTMIFARGIQRDHPDAIALTVMNDILGGGGFTSRVTNRVRSDEGLAYTAVTLMRPQVYFPGIFAGFYQSKNPTVALAAKIIMEEIERIRSEQVTAEELERTKNGFIEQFPQRFASKSGMLSTFVSDHLTGRDPNYWRTYREKVAAVDQGDVQRVAREHLDPTNMSILVVGDWDAIEGGDLEGRANMSEFGEVEHLPMLDPLTREPEGERTPTGP